jgi:HK97 family phage portal protein
MVSLIPWRKRAVQETTLDDVPGLTGIDSSSTFGQFLTSLLAVGFSPRLVSNVWCANRCLQLCSQQIASFPLRFIGRREPAWLTNPDPVWYANGISDAVFAATASIYGWGDAFLYVTSRYSDGLPAGWTVLDPAQVSVRNRGGVRVYDVGGRELNREDVVQITRNPTNALRGTSALRSYSSHLWGALTSAEASRSLQGENALPPAVLKSARKLTEAQAIRIQDQWATRRAASSGRPPVLEPGIDLVDGPLASFSPRDLMLLEAQEFDARVIASAFSVPAFLLNMPLEGGLTYQNPEILFDYWWRVELRPTAKRISDALTAQMLPRGSSVRFDPRESLEPGLKDLHTVWFEALQQGAVTQDEYRRAVLQLGPQSEGTEAIDELLEPNTAGASPSDQPSAAVVTLRPTGVVT